MAVTPTPPPPLQIKIVPATLHSDLSTPIIVTTATSANPAPVIASTTISASAHLAPVEVQVEKPREELVTGTDEAVTEEPEEVCFFLKGIVHLNENCHMWFQNFFRKSCYPTMVSVFP